MKYILALIILTYSNLLYAWQPEKPINVYIGFASGSGNEISFKGISSLVENNTGVSFIIQNRPGAGGVVAMNEFIKKPNDGYHAYISSNQGIFVTAEFFQKEAVKYTLEDFDYVIGLAKSPLVIISSKASQITNIEEFIKHFKNSKEQINLGVGGGAHRLAFEYLIQKLKIDKSRTTIVEYKGPAQAALDVAGNHIDFAILPAAVAASIANTGKIVIIGICSERPIKGFENTPLMNKYVPGMNVYGGWGILLPKNTPPEVKSWYVNEFAKSIRNEKTKKFLEDNFMFNDETELNPKDFRYSMLKLREKWIPIISNFSDK